MIIFLSVVIIFLVALIVLEKIKTFHTLERGEWEVVEDKGAFAIRRSQPPGLFWSDWQYLEKYEEFKSDFVSHYHGYHFYPSPVKETFKTREEADERLAKLKKSGL